MSGVAALTNKICGCSCNNQSDLRVRLHQPIRCDDIVAGPDGRDKYDYEDMMADEFKDITVGEGIVFFLIKLFYIVPENMSCMTH